MPNPLASLGLGNINWMGGVSQVIYWVFYAMIGLFIIIAMVAVYYWLSYKIKVDVYPLYGSGKDGVFSVGKRKSNKVKWSKDKSSWQKLYPLFNKKKLEPFDDEFIYPGKKIIAFELNQQWFPGRINIQQTESGIRGEINPVPYWVRNWQAIEHKQNAIDFAKHDFWSDNKNFIWMLLSVGICCALCLGTVYFTYKFAAGGTASMDKLTEVLKNIGGQSGVGAPPG